MKKIDYCIMCVRCVYLLVGVCAHIRACRCICTYLYMTMKAKSQSPPPPFFFNSSLSFNLKPIYLTGLNPHNSASFLTLLRFVLVLGGVPLLVLHPHPLHLGMPHKQQTFQAFLTRSV